MALVSTALAVMLLANPAKAKENENIFYGVVTEAAGEAETFLSEFGFGITVNFDFGDPYRYDDEMFHAWADNLACYLENSHSVIKNS